MNIHLTHIGVTMKKFMAVLVLAFTTQAFAADIDVKQVKCSLFGNMKIKVAGLESHGRLGKGYLKANLPMRKDCNAVVVDFIEAISTEEGNSADVDMTTSTYTRRSGGGRDNDRVCETYERKTVNVKFSAYPALTFKRSQDKLIDVDHHCF